MISSSFIALIIVFLIFTLKFIFLDVISPLPPNSQIFNCPIKMTYNFNMSFKFDMYRILDFFQPQINPDFPISVSGTTNHQDAPDTLRAIFYYLTFHVQIHHQAMSKNMFQIQPIFINSSTVILVQTTIVFWLFYCNGSEMVSLLPPRQQSDFPFNHINQLPIQNPLLLSHHTLSSL